MNVRKITEIYKDSAIAMYSGNHPKILTLKSNLQNNDFNIYNFQNVIRTGRKNPMNGISTLIKKPEGAHLPLPHMKTQ